MEDPHNNSSAYSSLANSNCDMNSGCESSTTASTKMAAVPSSADEIRSIIDDYNKTLKKATAQIKSLTRERHDLEVEYEKLLTLNEGIASDLERTVRHKRRLEEEHEAVLKANDELFDEAQRLNDEESTWIEDKENLEAELKHLRSEVQVLRRNEAEREAGELLADKTIRQIEDLREEKVEMAEAVTRMEIDNKKLSKEVSKLEKEREHILTRKEMVSGENMQLIMEAEEFHVIKIDLTNQLRTAQNAVRDLQKENSKIKLDFDTKLVDGQADKYASLMEKNKNLTEWREQLIEKNRVMTEENKKLLGRCTNLEELLNEEETDINDVLEMIRTVQVKTSTAGVH
jgi:chromosome segregation ATPase